MKLTCVSVAVRCRQPCHNYRSTRFFQFIKFFLLPTLLYYLYLKLCLQQLLEYKVFVRPKYASFVVNKSPFVQSGSKERFVANAFVFSITFRFIVLSKALLNDFIKFLVMFNKFSQLIKETQICLSYKYKIL